MTMLYPIVLETEDDGAVSAYVPGLPVYAAADTHAKAERAIRVLLEVYLQEHPSTMPEARVRVAVGVRRLRARAARSQRVTVPSPVSATSSSSHEATPGGPPNHCRRVQRARSGRLATERALTSGSEGHPIHRQVPSPRMARY
jgi:predicted RNase H-like HicB family nuclease